MLLESQIKEVFEYQNSYLEKLPEGTPREILEKIGLNEPHVTILTGIRRSGKSTVLLQLKNKLQLYNYFSFEDPRLTAFEVNDFFKLEKIFESSNYTFLFDEIQNVEGWERYIRVLHDQKKKVIITGSNARILSKELGTSLTGRQITYEIFPFSYSEFLKHLNLSAGIESFSEYLNSGGFPEFLNSNKREVLLNLYNDLIYRDIVVRHGLRNPKVLQELGVYLASNVGKEFSFNKLVKNFDLGSVNSLKSYISYFEDAFLFFTVPRFSFSLKQQAVNPKKVYAIDTGLISILSLSFSKDRGRLIENKTFIHLKRLGKEIFYFRKTGECDFIVSQNRRVEMIAQVCYELNADNFSREINGLTEAMDELKFKEGYIFTFNQEDQIQKDGKTIHVVPVWKWMYQK
ncbi:ATP-binding protein [Mariniphaga sp.]|uniref:ATP-binding protein n=1 Tax=Mariniphaga sp. TaxID=1954475 RepID=UPI003566FE60